MLKPVSEAPPLLRRSPFAFSGSRRLERSAILFLVRYRRENFPQLTAFLRLKEPVRPCLRTTNQLERTGKEIKRRCKVIEVFSSEDSLVSFVHLILRTENDKLPQRRL